MPTNRKRTPRTPQGRINPAAVKAFRENDADALYDALGLQPWEVNPLDVDDGPAPWPPGSAGYRSWPEAQRLKAELEQITGANHE